MNIYNFYTKIIRLKKKKVLYYFTISISITLIILSLLYIYTLFTKIQDLTTSFKISHDSDLILTEKILNFNRNLGAGGFVDNFKNYLIKREDRHRVAALQNLDFALDTLNSIVKLLPEDEQKEIMPNIVNLKNIILNLRERVSEVENKIRSNQATTETISKIGDINFEDFIIHSQKLESKISYTHHKIQNDQKIKFGEIYTFLKLGFFLVPIILLSTFLFLLLFNRLSKAFNSIEAKNDEFIDLLSFFPIPYLKVIIPSGQITFANKKFIDMVKISINEIKKCQVGDFISIKDDSKQFHKIKLDKLYNKKNPNFEIVEIEDAFIVNNSKQEYDPIPIKLNYSVHRAGKNNFISFSIRDTTRELQKEEKLLQLSKAKGDFLANMSHEIRTPLNVIMGTTELLEKEIKDQEEKQYIEMLKIAGKTLSELVNNILDFSKIEAKKFEVEFIPISLAKITKELKLIFSEKIKEHNNQLTFNISPHLEECIISDEIRIKQVLINLINNAHKFTENGTIEVEILKNPFTHLRKGNILFSVKDSGIGIDEEKLLTIFEAFTQADSSITRNYGGTGLGLSIAKGLIKLLGGDIWVVSELKKGSTFYFTISTNTVCPKTVLEKNGDEEISSINEDENLPTDLKVFFERKKMLLVDDSFHNRALIKAILKNSNIEIKEVENGIEAIKLFHQEKYDLILMDMQMPEMDGPSATKRIREIEVTQERKRTPIISLTANAFDEHRDEALKSGHDDFVSKPINRHSFFKMINKYLD